MKKLEDDCKKKLIMDSCKEQILVTGGAGYIGSHTVLVLLELGFEVVVLDNLYNSDKESITRVEKITGKRCCFYEGDVRDREILDYLFCKYNISVVIHLAGLKAVGDSMKHPIEYYSANVHGAMVLCQAMKAFNVYKLIFSSTATVYGEVEKYPINEREKSKNIKSPYGRSKSVVEDMLKDLSFADPKWCIGVLRYFNPIGAHPSGLIGEDPKGEPNNLVPFISQVLVEKLDELKIFGSDFPTHDGTGIRDYVHVIDLAEGHVKAMHWVKKHSGYNVWNLGSGRGYSVLQVIKVFEEVSQKSINYRYTQRRSGDVPESWAEINKAKKDLGWEAKLSLKDMIKDTWNWQIKNPNGYDG